MNNNEPKNTWVDWDDDNNDEFIPEPYDPEKDDFDAAALVQELLGLTSKKKNTNENKD